MKNDPSLEDTDLCVMCGMCTPLCPTYHVYKTEAESPRGRIALLHALDKGLIEPDRKVVDHLNHCLGCLACERICPSQVPFGKLIDAGRQRFTASSRSYKQKLLLRVSEHKQGLDYYHQPVSFLNHSGLIKLLPPTSRIRAIIEQAAPLQLEPFYPAKGSSKASIGLFKGCLGQTFDAQTLADAIKLLNYAGFDVHIPEDQYCCGALHQHNGDMDTATKLAEQNRRIFQQYELDTLLYTSTGCGSQIVNSDFSVPVVDLVSFLLKQLSSHAVAFKPLHKKIVVHQGCRGKNELGLGQTNQQLIEHIPGITLLQIEHKDLCCGAGGGNQLDYPQLANSLLDLKLEQLEITHADYLISDNMGCSLHFNTGIKHSQLKIEVVHPVTLLARQLI